MYKLLLLLFFALSPLFSAAAYTKNAASETTEVSQSHLITKMDSSFKLVIKPKDFSANDILLTVSGKNLYTGEYDNGYLKYGKSKLYSKYSKKSKTTKWFPILPEQGQSLVLSGTAHNRAVWQFQSASGKIYSEAGIPQNYKVSEDVVHNKTVSTVTIPEDAAYARVFFASLKDKESKLLDNRMQIEYGLIPTNYVPYETREITLPDLNEEDCLIYENNQWTLIAKGKIKTLDLPSLNLEAGDTITLDSTNSCVLNTYYEETSGKEIKYTGIYGVRWNRNDSNPVCERVGDGKGLHFNYVNGSQWATPYENDFDFIYPWSHMKLCAIKIDKNNKRIVTYRDSPNFALDGSVGNIMVEIPKFYSKREIIDDCEYLWISASKEEGFSLDPSFINESGTLEHIYVGAYLSSLNNKKLESKSDSFPVIKATMKQLKGFLRKTKGIRECDLLSILTIQKLYLVETAVLDSQSLFTGNVYLPYLLKDKSTSYYAIKSEASTNRIFVANTNMTQRFREGDAVSLLSSWKEFRNIPDKFQREITSIKEIGDDTYEIHFTGEPIDIIQGETGITCIPCKNGETDNLPYVTGSISGKSGHRSFKYRGIENLWGNVSIYLDQAYVKNSNLYIQYSDGKEVRISYPLPVQDVQLWPKKFGTPANIVVKTMGYDSLHPLIMFPSEIGNGALTSSYYCDAWYNLGKEDVTYVLTYGGAWDNKGYAGIFNFRATFTDNQAIPFNGSRIMIK